MLQMTYHPLFSILVPCCDVAPYVAECVESLKVQAVPFEAVFVVEESKDETESVVRAAIAGDDRFRIICEPRSGSPATPRNTGLKVATGEYVVFLDGDDTLTPTALADLARWMFRYPEADLYPCAIQEGDQVHDNYPLTITSLPLTGGEAMRIVCSSRAQPLAMAQMTVYRRAYLEEKGLRFVDGLRHEDEEFMPRALYLAASVVPTHLPFYLYRRRPGSIMSVGTDDRRLSAMAIVFRHLFRFHAELNPPLLVSRAMARYFCNSFFSVYFYEGGIAMLTPVHRAALKLVFADGFGDFMALARFASRPKRIAAWLVRLAVKTGWYGPVLAYFKYVYYPITLRQKG